MKEFLVEVIKEYEGIPAGARFYVKKETKHFYIGLWPNGPATGANS